MSVSDVSNDTNVQPDVELPAFADPAEPLPRDGYKRPLIDSADGSVKRKPYTRASTAAGFLSDGNALRVWETRNLALGLAKSPDLLACIAAADYTGLDEETQAQEIRDRKANLDTYIATALDRAGTKAKAFWGTAVHAFTEPGAAVDFVDPVMRRDVASYWEETVAKRGIVRTLTEVFVVNDEFAIAGTTDGVFEVPGWGLLVGDVKTGGLHPDEHAMQLAGYAGGYIYNHRDADLTRRRTPLGVRQDVGLLLHVPKGEGKTELYLINLEAGREAIRLALAVRAHRTSKTIARKFDDVVPWPDLMNYPRRIMLGIDAADVADVAAFAMTDAPPLSALPPGSMFESKTLTVAELFEAYVVGGQFDPQEQADPGHLEDAATWQQVAAGHASPDQLPPLLHEQWLAQEAAADRRDQRWNRQGGYTTSRDETPPPPVTTTEPVDLRAQRNQAIDEQAERYRQTQEAGRLASETHRASMGLGPSLQAATEADRQARAARDAEARAARDEQRAVANENPETPMADKVRTSADVRADAEAAGQQLGAAQVAQYREARALREEHGVEDVHLPEQPAIAPEPTSSPQPQTRVDVNGETFVERGDGFDDLRASDPIATADADHGAARGLVADRLGGREVSLIERIATAASRDDVNSLYREFSALGQWTQECDTIARQRVALLVGHP